MNWHVQRGNINGLQINENMYNFIINQENAYNNHNEIYPSDCLNSVGKFDGRQWKFSSTISHNVNWYNCLVNLELVNLVNLHR